MNAPRTPRRLRLLYLAVWHPYPPGTGSQIRSASLCDALAARHELDLIAFKQSSTSGPPASPPSVIRRWHVVDRAPFERRPMLARLGWFSRRPRHIVAMDTRAMRSIAAEWSQAAPYDVIIASTTALADVALSLPAGARVLEEHNFMARMLSEQLASASRPVERLRCRLRLWKDLGWERRLFARFDAVTMVSELDRVAALRAGCGSGRLAVVANGIDVEACRTIEAAAEPQGLIYPGSMTFAANRDAVAWFLREAWPELVARLPDIRLRVTGSTDGVDLSSFADVPGLEFTGHVDAVRPLIKSSQVCVVPLRVGGGTRLKVLEAMALGVPVVATAKAVEGLEVEAGQHFLEAESGADFVRQVEKLVGDVAFAADLAARAAERVEARYDWRAIGPHFAHLIEDAWLQHDEANSSVRSAGPSVSPSRLR